MSVKVLLIDDDEDDFIITRDLIRTIPGGEFDLEWARSFEAGLDAFNRMNPDVVLLDYTLGARTGLELLRQLRDSGSQTPIILLTGHGDRDIDVAAMVAGATDYLVKGEITAAMLDRAMRYGFSVASLSQKLADEHKRVMQAEKLSSIGMIAASVVHEVNNPLSGVRSLAAALDDESMPMAKRKEYHAAIREGLTRMAETMRGLLDLAREQPLTIATVSVLDVTSACLRLIAASLRAKGISADVRIPDDVRVRADRSQLMQALLNLLMNASDATPDGGKISVTLQRRGNEVGIAVSDTGTGIPKEIAEKVLEPFFTTKPLGKGTGLGLAIVSNIMKAHKGSVEIDSAAKAGATVTLWLPAI